MTTRLNNWFVVAVLVMAAAGCGGTHAAPPRPLAPELGSRPNLSTGRDDLANIIATRRAMLAERSDAGANVQLADALLRQARATGNAGLANEADRVLKQAATQHPDDHGICRMQAAVLMSQHKFSGARARAQVCRQREPGDTWILGVLADAQIELGEYETAWDTIDVMMTRRPNAASYSRASYARELQGDWRGALELMQMSLSATAPFDVESLAWHHAQIGQLLLHTGRLQEAEREFAHADYLFPGYPAALEGRTRSLVARGNLREALQLMTANGNATATPAGLALLGDIHAALGDADAAERAYQLAEAAWSSDAPEPARLARFLAERGRRLPAALDIAVNEAAQRKDIFSEDTLAWALYQSGRLDEAQAAMTRALRTGSRDRTIRYHAAAIAAARGDRQAARTFLSESIAGAPASDLITAAGAARLRQSLMPGSQR